ncbi:Uu.00g134800.m01.CDS01 [Anthostomella pinea]|uniref:Uu.00g134800.m01.CDS01 n=1 Tax=Anthostomella pinea TaxID=933095 RepID=A0AAI8VIK7_9PEZI|nr:Uu.00g134800.m01.CDS01 [Anthostomella pinea]
MRRSSFAASRVLCVLANMGGSVCGAAACNALLVTARRRPQASRRARLTARSRPRTWSAELCGAAASVGPARGRRSDAGIFIFQPLRLFGGTQQCWCWSSLTMTARRAVRTSSIVVSLDGPEGDVEVEVEVEVEL